MKEYCGKDLWMIDIIERHAERITHNWRVVECEDLELWRDTVILKGDWFRSNFMAYERAANKIYEEPEKIEKFRYVIGGSEGIESAYKWKGIKESMEKRKAIQNEKIHIQVRKENEPKRIIILQGTELVDEKKVETQKEDDEKEEKEFIREMDKWYLKPKKLNWKQKRKKKGKWKKFRERKLGISHNILEKVTKKVRIKHFGKPFREENDSQIFIYQIQEEKELEEKPEYNYEERPILRKI
jgi:hypothetical protein